MRNLGGPWIVATSALLPAAALAQPCPVPCVGGNQVLCSHQNGIRNCTGGAAPVLPIAGPNAGAPGGNVAGDAEWKIWGCENGMTRASGVHSFTNWEVGLSNLGPTTATFDLPGLELRPVVLGPAGVRVPDFAVAPTATFSVGTIGIPPGNFRVNVSIGQGVATLGSCLPPTSLPALSNADVAALFPYAPGIALGNPAYPFQLQTQRETTFLSNGGNSYSGTFNAATGALTSYAPNQEIYCELGFYEPTLEALRQRTAGAAPATGAGSREFAPGNVAVLRSLDWGAGTAAVAGQDRLAAVLFSDASGGNPFCQPPGTPGFLQGSIFVPGSAGAAAIFPTSLTAALLSWSAGSGNGMNCHALNSPCFPAGVPSIFSDMVADTPPILVPPGLAGIVLHAAALYVNLATLTVEDGSNTVEILFQ